MRRSLRYRIGAWILCGVLLWGGAAEAEAEIIGAVAGQGDYTGTTEEKASFSSVSDGPGCVPAEKEEAGSEEASAEEPEQEESRRQKLVEFALQFVGGRYRMGGEDPHSGVDCSGFTRYVMLHGAGVPINRNSRAQAQQGVEVSADEMRQGDLIFYSKGNRINHVALYIGNGQVVHASTEKTGIKLSPWNYRPPVTIRNVLGD